MAAMEAMARALPVVAFRVGGLPEHFPPSTTHLLASPGDSSGLATILRFLLKDLEKAASLGSSNYRTSQKFPSWGESSWQVLQFIHRRMGAQEQ
jgi:glycosyltransferase involved in cell wall biosynthesis